MIDADDVSLDDIEKYRRALTREGGEASIPRLIELVGDGLDTVEYVTACLLIPTSPNLPPFAVPSAFGRDEHGDQLWRALDLANADDLAAGRALLMERAAQHEADARRLEAAALEVESVLLEAFEAGKVEPRGVDESGLIVWGLAE